MTQTHLLQPNPPVLTQLGHHSSNRKTSALTIQFSQRFGRVHVLLGEPGHYADQHPNLPVRHLLGIR